MSVMLIGKRIVALRTLIIILIVTSAACVPATSSPVSITSTVPPTPSSLPPSPAVSPTFTVLPAIESKYSFEDELHGWMPQTFETILACTRITQSTEQVQEGQFSLKLDMELIGSDAAKSQGEAWVDMRTFPPPDENQPFESIDLRDHTVTLWVYAPSGLLAKFCNELIQECC